MSYVLHIWQQPTGQSLPDSVEAADRLLSELHSTRSGQNALFVQLAQLLTALHPCICSPEAENVPEFAWAWSDGPVNGKSSSLVLSIGLNVGMLEKIRPLVIKYANDLGLNVMDGQAGEVFRADRQVLSISATSSIGKISDTNYEDVPTAPALQQLIFDGLKSFMEQQGFKAVKSRHAYKYTFPNGWHEIRVFATDWWPTRGEFHVSVNSRFNAVTDLISKIATPDRPPADVRQTPTLFVTQKKWVKGAEIFLGPSNDTYEVSSFSQITAVQEHLLLNLRTHLLPILKKCEVIGGLDEVVNPNPVSTSMFFRGYVFGQKHIITAFLAESPKLIELCEEFCSQTRNCSGDEFNVVSTRKCIEYVQSQLSPLSKS